MRHREIGRHRRLSDAVMESAPKSNRHGPNLPHEFRGEGSSMLLVTKRKPRPRTDAGVRSTHVDESPTIQSTATKRGSPTEAQATTSPAARRTRRYFPSGSECDGPQSRCGAHRSSKRIRASRKERRGSTRRLRERKGVAEVHAEECREAQANVEPATASDTKGDVRKDARAES